MSITVGYTNAITSPATGPRSLAPEPLNFADDFRVIAELPNEVVLANINAPVTQPEQIRFAFSEVNDIFKGTKIDASGSGLTVTGNLRKGCSVLVQSSGVGLDAESNPFPYSAHLVLKVPYGPEPTGANIIDILERLLGALYETKATSAEGRINALIRGALTPKDL